MSTVDNEPAWDSKAKPFKDKRNIILVGVARVIWAAGTADQPAGYVLPGGNRTTDPAIAQEYAQRIDNLLSKEKTK